MNNAKLCGATIWIDWTMGGPLRDRLFEFVATGRINGEIAYEFIPYKRKGYPRIHTYSDITRLVGKFKPFLIDPNAFIGAYYGK